MAVTSINRFTSDTWYPEGADQVAGHELVLEPEVIGCTRPISDVRPLICEEGKQLSARSWIWRVGNEHDKSLAAERPFVDGLVPIAKSGAAAVPFPRRIDRSQWSLVSTARKSSAGRLSRFARDTPSHRP